MYTCVRNLYFFLISVGLFKNSLATHPTNSTAVFENQEIFDLPSKIDKEICVENVKKSRFCEYVSNIRAINKIGAYYECIEQQY